jgi:tetratricopeptide (TPR) repeat protein/predicted membrane protein
MAGEAIAVARPLATAARKAIPWAINHSFIARPAVWNALLAVWFILTSAAVVLGVGFQPLFLVLAVVLAVLLAGLVGWYRLTKPSQRPVIFLTEFAPATPGAGEASAYHRRAVKTRMEAGQLAKVAELRPLPAAVTKKQAQRLLDIVPSAHAVVYGEVQAIGGVATWHAELLVRWPGDRTAGGTHVQVVSESELVVENFQRDANLPDRHELRTDVQLPLERLVAERFEADHVDRIEGTLLVAGAVAAEEREDSALAASLLAEADRYRGSLSAQTRATLEVTRVTATGLELAPAIAHLAYAGARDAGHLDLWNHVSGLAFLGHVAGIVPPAERLVYAQAATESEPANPIARYNLGEALMALGRAEDALRAFDAIADHPDYRNREYLHLGRGVVAWNLGRYEAARKAYGRAVRLRDTARGNLYLADAHRAVGEVDAARKHYLRALRLQPTLVDAHRGFWFIEGKKDAWRPPSPVFDRLYLRVARLPRLKLLRHRLILVLLRWHHRRHPEDSRIHFMLGAHAVLGGDLATAEERLAFALELVDGEDPEALGRLALARGMAGKLEEAAADLERLWTQPTADEGLTPTADVRTLRAADFLAPFVDELELLNDERVRPVLNEFLDRFGPVVGDVGVFMRDMISGRIPIHQSR